MNSEVKDLILEFAEPDFEITEDTLLKNDLGLTSFEMVCIADRLCAIKGEDIPESSIRLCRTVGDLCDCLKAPAQEVSA